VRSLPCRSDWRAAATIAIHELSLMMALADQVLDAAEREGADRVTVIHLKVGTLAGVDPQSLATAAEVVLAGTCAEGARLAIESVPAVRWCSPCAGEFVADGGLSPCPLCGTPSATLLRGREFILRAIEILP
jgi:hydrogenase nickel incorporation protein HypA/HybF